MSSRWTSYQIRAIVWYAHQNDLQVMLSLYPTAYFIDKRTNVQVKGDITELVQLHRTYLKGEAKERIRQRRNAKNISKL